MPLPISRLKTEFVMHAEDVPVHIIRKPIKNMYLRVRALDGSVELTAPSRYDDQTILAFVLSKMEWIKGQIQQNRLKYPPESFPPVVQPVWGADQKVEIETGPRSFAIKLSANGIRVSTPVELTPQIWCELLNSLLRSEVEKAAPAIIESWRDKLALPSVAFVCKPMKSRWGTCHFTKNKIVLNSQLAAKPAACLEQVIVHELLHFFVPNHGPAFKALLTQYLPAWRKTEALLR